MRLYFGVLCVDATLFLLFR